MNGMDAIVSADKSEKVLLIKSRNASQQEISVMIEDTGVGLTPESADKIFDTFFTTQGPGHRDGTVYQPVNRGVPRRPAMGDAATGGWYYFSVHGSGPGTNFP